MPKPHPEGVSPRRGGGGPQARGAAFDDGVRPGVTTADAEPLRVLKRRYRLLEQEEN